MEIMRQSFIAFELLNGRKPCFKTLFNKLFKNILPNGVTLLVFLIRPSLYVALQSNLIQTNLIRRSVDVNRGVVLCVEINGVEFNSLPKCSVSVRHWSLRAR